MKLKKFSIQGILIVFLIPFLLVAQNNKYSLKINSDKVISSYNMSMLLGSNVGVYYEESYLMNLQFLDHLRDLNPGIIRMPGGSWSNELYWNGNRVRISKESYIEKEDWDKTIKRGGNPIEVGFDTSKYKNKKWEVDYSGYAPGFRVKDNENHLSDFHGFTDVLFLHKFIQALGAETMVTVNMGTGTVEMAVEWVKWTKQRKKYAREPFDVKYWEMGNELDGHWEVGHFLPDGSAMNAKEYIRRYKLFATAMKKADPTIKVGGSVASSMRLVFIKELIQDLDAPIDFISFHAYPSNDKDTNFIKMANEAEKINDAVVRIKGWINEYRPDQINKIEIALTEWNIKVKEDITTVDLTNTLWSAVMIGEIAKSGVDIACQWDMFSTTATGGHGLFNPNDPKMSPRSQYWASFLWNHYMGNKMIESKLEAPDYIRSYTTKNDEYLSVMIINGSKDKKAAIKLEIPDIKNKTKANEISYSKEQFQLNIKTLLPYKSKKPVNRIIELSKKTDLILDPYSIKIIQYPLNKN